jgi:hypothetical protein
MPTSNSTTTCASCLIVVTDDKTDLATTLSVLTVVRSAERAVDLT